MHDAANYVGAPPFVITHAISIANDGAGAATIVAPGADAIDIQAGAGDAVSINGLILDGSGTGTNGVNLTSAGSLTVANCTVKGFGFQRRAAFTGNGILIDATSGAPSFDIVDTIISGNSFAGIQAFGPTSGGVKNVNAGDNSYGLLVGVSASATVVESFFLKNVVGLYVASGNVSLSNSAATGNTSNDLYNNLGVLTSYQNNIYGTAVGTIAKASLH